MDFEVTKDKDKIRKLIFENVEDNAILMCREISKYKIYDAIAGFGLYLYRNRFDNSENCEKLAETLEEISTKLENIVNDKDETHHVWIVLQQVMTFLSGNASEEFKDKVRKTQQRK